MNKQPQVTAQTKQNIMDAFWALYCEKRIEKITVKDITTKAGYNRSTFYEYFPDVYAVLDELENSLIPHLDQLPPVKLPNQSIGMPIDAFLDLYQRKNQYFSVLLGDHGDPAFVGKLKNAIKPTLVAAFANRVKVSPIELDYMIEYTLSSMIGIMSYWFRQENPISNKELFDLIHKFNTEGVMGVLKE